MTAVSDVCNVPFRVANVKKSNNTSNKDVGPKDLLHMAGIVRLRSSVSERTVTAVGVWSSHTKWLFITLLAVQSRELASHLDTKQHALQMWEVEMMASLSASGVLPQLSMDATPSPSEFFYHLLGSSNKWVLLFLQVILDLTKLERFKQGWIHKKQSVVLREVAFPITLPGLPAEGLREATFPILGRILRQGWEQAFW